jgi:hypothetical protein
MYIVLVYIWTLPGVYVCTYARMYTLTNSRDSNILGISLVHPRAFYFCSYIHIYRSTKEWEGTFLKGHFSLWVKMVFFMAAWDDSQLSLHIRNRFLHVQLNKYDIGVFRWSNIGSLITVFVSPTSISSDKKGKYSYSPRHTWQIQNKELAKPKIIPKIWIKLGIWF